MPASKKKAEATRKAVRSAVDKTFQATVGNAVGSAQGTRERAHDIVDDVVGAAARVRTVLEDLRVATGDDVRALRNEIAALERRVKKLEGPSNKAKRSTKTTS